MENGHLDEQRKFIDKWQMHILLSRHTVPDLHLPHTALWSKEALHSFCEHYRCLYIKPTDTWGGQAIARIQQVQGHWIVKSPSDEPILLSSVEEIWNVLNPRYQTKTIIQQCAPVASWMGRPLDIRALLQRDESDRWIWSGMLVRIGGENSVVSNVQVSFGNVQPPNQILPHILKSRALYPQVVEKIQTISYALCSKLDEIHFFEEVGIDYGVGRHGDLWLFEVNTNDALGGPSHELFAQLQDRRLYDEIEARWRSRQMNVARELWKDLFHSAEADNTSDASSLGDL